jgi:predicted ArsR family transcriptional regulator
MPKIAPGQYKFDFSPPKARLSDPMTSHLAARGVNVHSIRGLILKTADESPVPLASFQIAKILDKDRDSISPHMKPLESLGYMKRSGQTVKRPNGRDCETWELTDKGRAFLRPSSV